MSSIGWKIPRNTTAFAVLIKPCPQTQPNCGFKQSEKSMKNSFLSKVRWYGLH